MTKKASKKYKIIFKVVAGLIICVVSLPFLLYIPFIQNIVKDVAVSEASRVTGWRITLDRILIRFPLALSLDNFVVETAPKDTMLAAGNFKIDVKLIPLLKKRIEVGVAELHNGKYRMLSDDKSMTICVRADECRFDMAEINLAENRIYAVKARLDNGYMTLDYDLEKAQDDKDNAASEPWIVTVRDIQMNNIRYEMSMLPYIDRLKARVAHARLCDGKVDTGECTVDVRYFAIDSADCRYLLPTAEYIAKHPASPDTAADDVKSKLWTVRGDSVRLTNSHAIYAVRGAKPKKGLDMNYIEASDINIAVDSFYNKGKCVIVPLRKLSGRERCGINIVAAKCRFAMDSTMMNVAGLDLSTKESHIKGDAHVASSIFDNPQDGKYVADIDAELSLNEARLLYPGVVRLLPPLPSNRFKANVTADGTLRKVNLRRCDVNMPGLAQISAKGSITEPMNFDRFGCNIALKGNVGNLDFLKPTLLADTALRRKVKLPPLKLDGCIMASKGKFSGDAYLALSSGDIVFDAMWNGRSTDYSLNFNAKTLPLEQILPTSRLQLLSAQGEVSGHGFDIFNKSTRIKAEISVDSLYYNSQRYYGMMLNGCLNNGNFDATAVSSNQSCDFSATTSGRLERDHYVFSLSANVNDLNLYALNFSDVASNGCCNIDAYGDFDIKRSIYEGSLSLSNLRWTYDKNYYYTDNLELGVESDSAHFTAQAINGDFNVNVNAQCNLDTLIDRFTRCSNMIQAQYAKKSINIDTLRNVLPPFTCDMELGQGNIIQQYLESESIKFQGIDCKIANDSTIYMYGRVNSLDVAGVKLDTIHMALREENRRIAYKAHVGNRKGTMQGVKCADLSGALYGNTIEAEVTQTDFKDRQGFRLGLRAELSDTTVRVNIFPKNPIIGYKEWTVNNDNNVSFNYQTKHFDANLVLKQHDSEVSLLTQHDEAADADGKHQEDILLNIRNLQIADWLSLSPFAPPLSGVLGSNIKVKYDGKNLWGDAVVDLNDVTYDRRRVGDFQFNTMIDLNPANGGTAVTGNVVVNGRQCVVAFGSLNDSISREPFLLALELDKFPLDVVNPFLPKDMVELTGSLDGLMKVTGSPSKPIFDGYIQCDSTKFSMPMFGTTVNLPSEKLPVDSSVIKLNQYAIKGINGNPVVIDGMINAQDIDNMYLDLTIAGDNVQFVNAKQTRKSAVFGRGYVNIDTSVRGYMDDLDVDANLSLLSGSNITYVMTSDISAIAEKHEQKIVKFVQFNDTSYVSADTMANVARENRMNLNASLSIQSGTTLSVYLSKNGADRAEIHGNGDLLFSINRLGDQSLIGQYNIESGFVRYSPPLISQKNFQFKGDSYVRWTGDVMNPHLNLSAYETHKTNVTQSGEDSRIVDFIIDMDVTNTLADMDVKFDLSTNDDVTVQNELSTMSAAQRSSQAINLLLYNTYTGADTQATGNLAGNPLFSFLTSKINDWAASTLKGISVSVGFNQYDETHDGISSREVKYSYQVSKSLFDDRFKIVVGGDYSPSTTSGDEIAKELFNDVSLEYSLNKGGNMLVRIFNHTSYVNMLEGKVTQTGVAFVYKRKLANLKHLFIFDVLKKVKGDKKKAPSDTEQMVKTDVLVTEDSNIGNRSKMAVGDEKDVDKE